MKTKSKYKKINRKKFLEFRITIVSFILIILTGMIYTSSPLFTNNYDAEIESEEVRKLPIDMKISSTDPNNPTIVTSWHKGIMNSSSNIHYFADGNIQSVVIYVNTSNTLDVNISLYSDDQYTNQVFFSDTSQSTADPEMIYFDRTQVGIANWFYFTVQRINGEGNYTIIMGDYIDTVPRTNDYGDSRDYYFATPTANHFVTLFHLEYQVNDTINIVNSAISSAFGSAQLISMTQSIYVFTNTSTANENYYHTRVTLTGTELSEKQYNLSKIVDNTSWYPFLGLVIVTEELVVDSLELTLFTYSINTIIEELQPPPAWIEITSSSVLLPIFPLTNNSEVVLSVDVNSSTTISSIRTYYIFFSFNKETQSLINTSIKIINSYRNTSLITYEVPLMILQDVEIANYTQEEFFCNSCITNVSYVINILSEDSGVSTGDQTIVIKDLSNNPSSTSTSSATSSIDSSSTSDTSSTSITSSTTSNIPTTIFPLLMLLLGLAIISFHRKEKE